jgi:hypothetical protein
MERTVIVERVTKRAAQRYADNLNSDGVDSYWNGTENVPVTITFEVEPKGTRDGYEVVRYVTYPGNKP